MYVNLCDDCRASERAWLTRTGPIQGGIQIVQIGTGAHNVPSWTRTHELVRSQIQTIHEICRRHHGAVSST